MNKKFLAVGVAAVAVAGTTLAITSYDNDEDAKMTAQVEAAIEHQLPPLVRAYKGSTVEAHCHEPLDGKIYECVVTDRFGFRSPIYAEVDNGEIDWWSPGTDVVGYHKVQ